MLPKQNNRKVLKADEQKYTIIDVFKARGRKHEKQYYYFYCKCMLF